MTARRLLALLACRLYAVLPCVVTALVAGLLTLFEHGVAAAAGIVTLTFALMAFGFGDFLERPAAAVGNAMIYFVALALPALLIPWRGLAGFAAGTLAEAAIDVALLALVPVLPARLARAFQPELFADVLTGLVLVGLLGVPLRLLRRGSGRAGSARPPYHVTVVVCAYQEEGTIDRCLDSVLAAARRVRGSPLVRSLRVVLADSSPDSGTRERLAPKLDRVLPGARGKLRARHAATLAEPCDVLVAADADRCYDEDWLLRLLEPFEQPGVVASMGETRNWGAPMSGSALCRAGLGLPLNGGNSAYLRAAYLASPFDPAIDEFDHRRLWLEEEFLFGLKLQALGRVVHVARCRSYELRPYPMLRQLARHLFGARLRTF